MATLSDLRTTIAAKLSDVDLISPTSSQIDEAINSTIDYYQNNYFWFQQGTSALTTVSGTATLSGLPSDFYFQRHPNSFVLEKDNRFYELKHITPQRYDEMADTNSSGLPRFYTYRDDVFEMFPYPDDAYTVNMYYYKSYADLVSDGDSNDFTDNARRLVEYKTLSDLFLDYRSDPENYSIYLAKTADELKIIKRETNNRLTTGELTIDTIIDSSDYSYYY